MQALSETPGGLSCSNCPAKAHAKEAGRRWGPKLERYYCHGGMSPDHKGPRDGCAVLWPTWGLGYYVEMSTLIIDNRMPPPGHLTKDDYRMIVRVRNKIKELQVNAAKGGDLDVASRSRYGRR